MAVVKSKETRAFRCQERDAYGKCAFHLPVRVPLPRMRWGAEFCSHAVTTLPKLFAQVLLVHTRCSFSQRNESTHRLYYVGLNIIVWFLVQSCLLAWVHLSSKSVAPTRPSVLSLTVGTTRPRKYAQIFGGSRRRSCCRTVVGDRRRCLCLGGPRGEESRARTRGKTYQFRPSEARKGTSSDAYGSPL